MTTHKRNKIIKAIKVSQINGIKVYMRLMKVRVEDARTAINKIATEIQPGQACVRQENH